MFSRREVLVGGVGCIFAPRIVLAQTVVPQLIAENAEMQLISGSSKTAMWRFTKQQPIAVLRAKQGLPFRLQLVNKLEQEIALHWFGVRGQADMMTVFAPAQGEAVDVEFTPPDAGCFWFGPLTNVSQQRDMGLYGMLIVDEAQPPDFTDIPLIVDDWKIDDSGKMVGGFNNLQDAIGLGRMGNWFTLNGTFKTHIAAPANKPLRLRVLNVANVRTMNVLFKGSPCFVAALDGQPIPLKPLGQEALVLAPGQRADVVVPHLVAQLVISLDLQEDVAEIGFIDAAGPGAPVELPDNFALAANPLSPLGDVATARIINIAIAGGAKGGLQTAFVGTQQLNTRELLEKGLAWALNGVAGPGGPALFDAKKGETLILTLDNTTSFAQPMHIHGHVWQVVEQDGQPLEAQAWRDTVVVPGLSKMKVALVADNVGLWAIHSLMAERCDAGLLGSFTVADTTP
jgi:FtsP/CotA-like multicopper oxidase with cupredoxin domain